MTSNQLNFDSLVSAIQNTHDTFSAHAVKAVNICLTIRNWLIGYYIVEYELQGADRANYGDYLLNTLSEQLVHSGLKRMDIRELRRFRQFYTTYPQIRETVSPVLASLPLVEKINLPQIRESLTPEFQPNDSKGFSPINPCLLVERLSFTHLVELMQLDPVLKRQFYEVEAIRGNWSVRELKRQIATQYFERSGLSLNKEALADMNNSLFVSRYQLQLPPLEEIEAFLQQAIAELDPKN